MAFQLPNWVETRSYQQTAVGKWLQSGGKGILRMATGTGKTITALSAAHQISERLTNGFVLVIAVPYQHLVDQWAEEVREFGKEPVLAYQSRRNWQPLLERELLEYSNSDRDVTVVITTHRTLSGEAARRTFTRNATETMLIADEVHHLGAEQSQKGLVEQFPLRLGLSATPERWYDEDGTKALESYFGGTVFEYGISEAIADGSLCEYYYVPHIVELEEEELEEYLRLSQKIGRLMQFTDSENGELNLEDNEQLERLLFKRARLIGGARQKIEMLVELFQRQANPSHSLVYCAQGSGNATTNGGPRHIDMTTSRLRKDCGLKVERFTARENQSEREDLLSRFSDGELDVLTSIRCLDEGVDVPATRTAYLLASTANPRQYIQRRGRILRPSPGKDIAVIHDFITIPNTSQSPEFLTEEKYRAERALIKKELQRVTQFAEMARNHPDADVDGVPTTDGSLQEIKRRYNLLSV